MRVQQVPNSPYFIHYDDEGFCCISKSRESQEPIPESEMQAFLDSKNRNCIRRNAGPQWQHGLCLGRYILLAARGKSHW